jgi:deazaflavin-dependent oxidoreductase (nitroreductase family)
MAKNDTSEILAKLAAEDYCYLTTTGRVSGKPHEIEIWFGVDGDKIYLLSGGGNSSDWVKNLRADSAVKVRIAKKKFNGTARALRKGKTEQLARQLLAAKYYNWRAGKKMNEWATTALPVEIKLAPKD